MKGSCSGCGVREDEVDVGRLVEMKTREILLSQMQERTKGVGMNLKGS